MIRTLAIVAVLTLTAAGCSSGDAADSSSTTVPPLGDPTAAEQPQWLYTFTSGAAAAAVDGDSVTVELTDAAQSATAFTDRPDRRARQISTPGILAQWDTLFGGDPPNASITGRTENNDPRTWVVEIDTASATADATVRFEGRLLDGDSTDDPLNDVAVFIDDVVAPDCEIHDQWINYPDPPRQLIESERFWVTATTTSAAIDIRALDVDAFPVVIGHLEVRVTRGGVSSVLPSSQVPSFAPVTDSDGGRWLVATVPPIDSWAKGDTSAPASLVVSGSIGFVSSSAYVDCNINTTVPPGDGS